MTEHKRRYLRELDSANRVIRQAGALITDPDDPEWVGVDGSMLPPDFVDYYRGLVSAGYYNGFI